MKTKISQRKIKAIETKTTAQLCDYIARIKSLMDLYKAYNAHACNELLQRAIKQGFIIDNHENKAIIAGDNVGIEINIYPLYEAKSLTEFSLDAQKHLINKTTVSWTSIKNDKEIKNAIDREYKIKSYGRQFKVLKR